MFVSGAKSRASPTHSSAGATRGRCGSKGSRGRRDARESRVESAGRAPRAAPPSAGAGPTPGTAGGGDVRLPPLYGISPYPDPRDGLLDRHMSGERLRRPLKTDGGGGRFHKK